MGGGVALDVVKEGNRMPGEGGGDLKGEVVKSGLPSGPSNKNEGSKK